MPQLATQRLDSIHSMLSAGQRSLRIERHTLILWGLTGGILCLISDNILTEVQFPDNTQRALAWLLLLIVSFGSVAIMDWHLTRRAKQVRDEAWSFIHRQVLKIFWLLAGIGILFTFAMFFFGGGYMIFGAWLILLGVGLYVHGLFSEELLEWAGILMILIGVMSLGFQLPYETMKWIAASVFGIGCPLLAAMLDRGRSRPSMKRMAQSALWVAAVMLPPLLAHRYASAITLPEVPPIPLATYRQMSDVSGFHIVTIPAGTEVPVRFEVSGNLFDHAGNPVLPLKISKPLEVALRDGKLTGETRIPGGNWLPAREASWIEIPWLKAELTPDQGAVVRGSLVVKFKGNVEQ
ncbi:MAG TPA: hypothetical protein VFF26_01540 [Gallionella sp.]|nr:hypothetical protein [Gallionella sp.]